MWDALRLDVWQSFRSLRRASTFSLTVIATLTLAVGATAAVGSLLNAVVLRTVAVPSPEQLVALSALDPRANVDGYVYPDTFNAYRDVQRSFAEMSMYAGGGLVRVETRSGVSEEAVMETVSPSYFDLVGARIRRCGGRDQRGVPPAHLRHCQRRRRGNHVQRGAGDSDRHRGGRFRRSSI